MTTPESYSPAPDVIPTHVLSREEVQEQSRNIERAERLNLFVNRLGETGLHKVQMDTVATPVEPDGRLADRLDS